MPVVRSIPTTAGFETAKIQVSSWNMFVKAQKWTSFAPWARKGCRPLLHGDDRYQCRISRHAPTVAHSTVIQRWLRRTHWLPARRCTPPPHYLGEVREYPSTCFPGRWIDRAAPIAWSPRSPDLTPLGFSYGDSLKIQCSYHLCLQLWADCLDNVRSSTSSYNPIGLQGLLRE
jgi:hypothetical protein